MELNTCFKFQFSNPYIFAIWLIDPYIFAIWLIDPYIFAIWLVDPYIFAIWLVDPYIIAIWLIDASVYFLWFLGFNFDIKSTLVKLSFLSVFKFNALTSFVLKTNKWNEYYLCQGYPNTRNIIKLRRIPI